MCFDVDCTVTVNDTLDLLAEHMGVGEAVADLTKKVMRRSQMPRQSYPAGWGENGLKHTHALRQWMVRSVWRLLWTRD